MKARVIANGKIVEVVANGNYYDTTDNKERYYSHELDFQDTSDYWTRLEHQYAGMAMQGILSRQYVDFDKIIEKSVEFAHALVEELKKKEERK